MPQFLRAYAERAISGDPGTPIRFTASTENIARDGIVIASDGWDLENFKANPTFLWSHDYLGNRPPIGRVASIEVKDKKLMADVVFDQGDEFARQVERKYRDGFLSAVSVGWDTKQIEPPKGSEGVARVTVAELLDLSGVNIPGDPGALMERQKRAYADMGKALLELADIEIEDDPPTEYVIKNLKVINTESEPTTARATWPETAAQMVRLFWPFAQGPDEDREKAYRTLVRDYGRHGKTAPEFLTANEVDALSVDDIRAHCLEGEPELLPTLFAEMGTRAGAVLSKRNRDAIQQIADLAIGVLESVKKEADQSDDERAAEASIRELRSLFVKDQNP